MFNQLSSSLEGTYRDLTRRVAELDLQLEGARADRRRQRAEKERLAERLSSLLAELPAGVVVLDRESRVEDFNPGAAELLGDVLVLEAPWQTVSQSCFVAWPEAGEAILRSGRRVTVARRELSREAGWIMVLTDVTEVRELHGRLARHERLSEMGEMAARLAHQIRTPLSAALLYASQLSRPVTDAPRSDADTGRFAGKIVERLKHLEAMVNDVLAYARGIGNQPPAEFSLGSLIVSLRRAVEPLLADGARLEVAAETDVDLDDLVIRGNREALTAALMNLVSNALEASGPGARVTLEAHRELGDSLVLLITDDGPGIPAEIVERIFDPFFTTRPSGTGLGLAVVRSVVDAHGGSVGVCSPPSGGCRISVRLPITQTPGVALLEDRPARSDDGRARERA